MSNPWVEHVKKYAKDNNISYACAVSQAKASYVKQKTPKKKAEPKKKPEQKLNITMKEAKAPKKGRELKGLSEHLISMRELEMSKIFNRVFPFDEREEFDKLDSQTLRKIKKYLKSGEWKRAKTYMKKYQDVYVDEERLQDDLWTLDIALGSCRPNEKHYIKNLIGMLPDPAKKGPKARYINDFIVKATAVLIGYKTTAYKGYTQVDYEEFREPWIKNEKCKNSKESKQLKKLVEDIINGKTYSKEIMKKIDIEQLKKILSHL